MFNIQDISPEALCKKYGTPLYVYDSQRIIDNYTRFTESFQVKKLKVHYACKALSNVTILQLFNSLGSGLDCVSIQEVELGLMAGFSPNDIVFTPNNISEMEYNEVVKKGVTINVDNMNMLEYMGMNHPNIPLFIRINPHLMAGGNSKISTGHIDSKFGISIHQVPNVKRIVDRLNINIAGIHVHTGSDILDSDVFIHAAELIFSVVEQFDTVQHIDFGSGFKVKYHQDDLHTEIESFGFHFSKAFNAFCTKMGKEYTLQFEPGKFMVSDAGYFFANANLVKQTTSCTFVGLDSGFNHFVRPMFYDAYHEIENVSNPEGDKKIYTIVGNICETDTFGADRILNEVRKNDIIMFRNAGAYCFTMASNYNSRFRPAEVLIHNRQDYMITKRESLKDLVKNQVMPEIDEILKPV
ncbi:MAG: diaminopimelate decarboxylase [Bacteroidia bacterium]|nr:diaminopimelate decarboxylase [Bacteroidia bacterium]